MPLFPPAAGSTTSGVVPVGGIILWSGTIASIPTDWALCDGTANTPGPDLRDKFVVCATQDDLGAAKTNIEGSLKVTGGVTGVSHSAHANLTHAGGAVADHTGLTHGLTIADHPDLTHAALSHAASTITHADHSVASFTGSHASNAGVSVPSGSVTIASGTHSHAASTITGGGSVTNTVTRSVVTTGGLNLVHLSPSNSAGLTATVTNASFSGTHASQTGAIASVNNASNPSGSHTHAAITLTHADHSFPSLSHQAIGTHTGLSHAVTAPAAHGAAGTLTHSFTQPNDHVISAHDTVLSIPNYYALAFIQRMA